MRLKRLINQTAEIITVEEAKIDRGLDLDFEDHDILIQGLIKTARAFVETKLRGQIILSQIWEQTEVAFADPIRLGLMPIISIDSVKYIDTDGALQTLAETEYELDNSGDFCYLRLAYDKTWPTIREQHNSVQIRMTAGHAKHTDVPAELKIAMMLIVGHLYENREATTATKMNELPFGVDAFLGPHSLVHLQT